MFQAQDHEELSRSVSPFPLPPQETVNGWGRVTRTVGHVVRPTSSAELAQIFHTARQHGLTVGLRGGGNSYGDAAVNSGGIVLDLTRMKRILQWNPTTGVITVEPGVRLRELWEYALGDGWWPPVSTGTQNITVGGGVAMNVHGKNAYCMGTIGDHVLEFDLMLPTGETITCSRRENDDVFYAAIGGFGMLGCLTQITLQMKRVTSGDLQVDALACADLGQMFRQFRLLTPSNDYVVGWVDTTATGSEIGRGQIHAARYIHEHEPQTLRVAHQHLGDAVFNLVPRSQVWRLMQPFFRPIGIHLINEAKFRASQLVDGQTYRQPHAQFHFLLNYFPDWERAVGQAGLIQYQPFVPEGAAEIVFRHLLILSQRRGLAPYLGVLKRHRPDPFLLTHGLDGFSLALDYRVTNGNRERLAGLCREMDAVVVAAGGRFYPAKDSTLRPEVARAYLGKEAIGRFRALKQRCDPDNLLQTNFWRRVFAEESTQTRR